MEKRIINIHNFSEKEVKKLIKKFQNEGYKYEFVNIDFLYVER